ncbi:MAG: GNAT family N-acetyltransferase [Ignavibacteriaceae bacterium]|nr:GNAT family N-acetyltransferase [Ignavibacteriaceae bacterium]
MIITRAYSDIIPKMSELHINSFDIHHFTSRFGRELLNSYLKFLIAHNNYSYVAIDEEQNKFTGYLICGDKTEKSINLFIKNNFVKVIKLLLKNPIFIIEKINEIITKLIPLIGKKSKTEMRVFIIAIDNKYQGKGTGYLLLKALESDLIKDSISQYGLSVRKENKKAIEFYNKNLFKIEFENKKSIFYIKKLVVR